ncbi:zinc-binding dehydrogenase [Bradyrhizobium uaiense]|uniref:zinc-binding dehydrogenase n=1 Tax=Bradyrhizobium uaiense TaxID=2594946 RepID=UPI0013D108A4
MKTIQISKYGRPGEVIDLVDVAPPDRPGPGEVIIAMTLAPIHPADLLLARGFYGVRPKLPAVLGGEGVGRVLQAGDGVALKRGDRVLVPNRYPCWAEQIKIPATGLFACPPDVPDDQLALVSVNPLTAMLMLDESRLTPGRCFIQNAANSGVGRAVIMIARAKGLRSVNLVRRQELIPKLKSIGADIVLLEGPNLKQRLAAEAGAVAIDAAFDGVAGESTAQLVACLAKGGTLTSYAGVSNQPFSLSPTEMIFRDINLRGFWLVDWLTRTAPEIVAERLQSLVEMTRQGTIRSEVAVDYAVEDFAAAIAHAQKGEGKILLRFGTRHAA